MPARAARRRWSRAAWRRLTLVLLWLGHGTWVLLGPNAGRAWTRTADTLALPAQGAARQWEGWRSRRRDDSRTLQDLQAENARLAGDLAALRLREAQEAPRLTEAEEALRVLGLRKLMPLELSAARVVFSTRPAAFGGLILDQGRDRGLVEDQGVLAPEGVVGRIWSVGPTQAKVLPVDAPNASVAVMLIRSRATGVLQGLGASRAHIRYVSNQEVVQPGEAVLTSGLDRVFPRGLLVGHVVRVERGELELELTVQLAAPLDRVSTVLLLPSQPPLEVQQPFVQPEQPKPASRKKGTP